MGEIDFGGGENKNLVGGGVYWEGDFSRWGGTSKYSVGGEGTPTPIPPVGKTLLIGSDALEDPATLIYLKLENS